MIKDYTKIIPKRFHGVSYETDVPENIKVIVGEQFKKKGGLYLYGENGAGKTHIAYAIIKRAIERELDVMVFNTGDFLERLREEFDAGYDDEWDGESLFRGVMDFEGLLLLDDIGAEKMTDWVRERLYLIINKKYEDMAPVIFTSNCDMEILSARVGDRIVSRIIGMTEIVKITGEDRRLSK